MNQRVRLKSGKFITRKVIESAPAELDAANPLQIWTCHGGHKILIKDMELKHLLNCIKVVEERTAAKAKLLGVPEGDQTKSFQLLLEPILQSLRDELDYRLGKKERPAKTVAASRAFDFST